MNFAAIAETECIHVPQHVAWLDARMDRLRQLRAINHGHCFGDNTRCRCGMSDVDYHTGPRDDPNACQSLPPGPIRSTVGIR